MALLSPQAAASELNISVKTLRGHVRDGSISYRSVGLGSRREMIRFSREDIDEFIIAQTRGPAPIEQPPFTPAEPSRKKARLSTRVYFIRAGDFIKIGVARDPKDRLSTLQTAHAGPLELLLHIPGGVARESRLHSKFHDLAERGEWFRAEPILLTYISKLRAKANMLEGAP